MGCKRPDLQMPAPIRKLKDAIQSQSIHLPMNMRYGLLICGLCVYLLASKGECQPPDTLVPANLEEMTEFGGFEDMEYSPAHRRAWRQRYDSCMTVRAFHDSIRYTYFVEHVYRPALKNPALSPENKRFLVQLKTYLQCPTDSCGRANKLIRPVYAFRADSAHLYHVIGDDFDYAESDNSYDGSGWGDDTLLTARDRATLYRIVYANAPVVKYRKIQRFRVLAGPCLFYKSYVLRKVPETDTLRPAFCSTFDLDLEWTSDPVMDSLLECHNRCENTFTAHCDHKETTVTFARLKGVPNLYFTIDRDTGWESWFPTRGLMMNYEGKAAISLWWRMIEMVGCACI